MSGITRAFRVVFGAALVVGGAMLLHPLGSLVADGYVKSRAVPSAAPVAVPEAPAPAPQQPSAAPPVSWLVPEGELPPPVALAPGYVPPAVPDRLPPTPAGLAGVAPDMNGTYRSTLAVPPPPLLDVQQVDAQPAAPAASGPPRPSVPASLPPLPGNGGVLQATHVVGDGDDLIGIATRVYGHPGAAAAVWAANRDILADPNLLPIGAELKLPPPWAVGGPGAGQADGRSIEPTAAAAPGQPIASPDHVHAAGGTPAWLAAAPRLETAPLVPMAQASVPARAAGGTVRLGPGETLETLAEKFYGDRAAAARIWAANRDRLRSPELAVVGMELRLP